MYKKTKPATINSVFTQLVYPHCDARILHAPGECEFCDSHPEWQLLRQAWGIAFTGYTPEGEELPCPADHARGNTHALWPGNVAQPKEEYSRDKVKALEEEMSYEGNRFEAHFLDSGVDDGFPDLEEDNGTN